jgi:hypothetical protein
LLSDEHFTVDGTLLEAWAEQKSFRRVDHNHQPPTTGMGEGSDPTVNFHREKRSNQTHCSFDDELRFHVPGLERLCSTRAQSLLRDTENSGSKKHLARLFD